MAAERIMLSVIIPLAPGEQEWRGLLPQLARMLPEGSEVLLVGAGEAVDGVREGWPRHIGLSWHLSRPGRAIQMNLGARRASGTWLWFLHADSRLEPGTAAALVRFIAREEPALGWFDLAFLSDGPSLLWLNAQGANLRARWLGLPFGDQGFVLPASSFAALGGYDEQVPCGEDHMLVWTVRHAGLPLRRVGAALATSGRRYQQHGWAATTLRHVRLTTAQAWRGWRHRHGAAA
jgi:rSAM/selenodomain-associated transferase 2